MQIQGVVRTGAREIQKNKQKYSVKYKIKQPVTRKLFIGLLQQFQLGSVSTVVSTSASHAEGREFNPRIEYSFCKPYMTVLLIRLVDCIVLLQEMYPTFNGAQSYSY
jgi:hypothetical protein